MTAVMLTMSSNSQTMAFTPSFADFARRAVAGDRLTVAFLGGSLTWGAHASDPNHTSYRGLICHRLEETYPHAHFRFVDAAIGGTGAQLGAFRLQRDVLDKKPDLVFLDFTLNDDNYKVSPDTLAAYESIVRRVIADGRCPLVQMFLASRYDVVEGLPQRMLRRDAHLAISRAYHTAVGDAISLMRDRYQHGQADIERIWPPTAFDNTHPTDLGYALYAEAAWCALKDAIDRKLVCTVPEKMLNDDTYMRWSRVRISSLNPLPSGWCIAAPSSTSIAFDFLMTRWLDDVCVAGNFRESGRIQTEETQPAKPLHVGFNGRSVLLFGESTLRSCKYRVLIDGELVKPDKNSTEFEARLFDGNGRLCQMVAEGLKPAAHSLEIQPLFQSGDTPGELRLESICIAGGQAKVWRINE
jgi:lysophospholipase L1-like esterase